MKKTISIIALITLITGNIKSQEIDLRDRLIIGMKAGLNYSNVYDTKGEEFKADAKFGAVAGLFLAIPIGKYLGIQPEVAISQRGFHATGKILSNTYEFTRTTSYVDVPLLFSLKPSEFLTLVGGPQYSYLIKQKDVFANATTSILQEQEFENDNIRKNILSFTGGFDITLKHFVIAARAGWDAQNNNGDGTSTTPRYKNVWYQVAFGLRLYN